MRGWWWWASAPTATALGAMVEALAGARPRRGARDRRARARAGGRPGGRARLPGRVPRRPRGRAPRRLPGRGARGRRRGCASPAAWSTPTCRGCCPPARPRWCRAPSPRRSAWWPPRPPRCGALPLSASHSGLAEVTATLAGALDAELRAAAVVRARARERSRRSPPSWSRGCRCPPRERERASAALADLARARLRLGGGGRGGDRGGPGAARRAAGAWRERASSGAASG